MGECRSNTPSNHHVVHFDCVEGTLLCITRVTFEFVNSWPLFVLTILL